MARRRIKHKQIVNEGKRNAAFGRRSDGLLKKASELSILCGVDAAIIAHKRGGENNAILWPSPAIFGERLQKYLDFSKMERERRMVTHEKYLEHTLIKAKAEDLSKIKKTNELKESQHLMNELQQQNKNFGELYLNQLNSLNSLANDMLQKLCKRDHELDNEQHHAQLSLCPSSIPPLLSFSSSGMLGAVMQQHTGIEASTSDHEQDVTILSRFLPNASGSPSSVGVGSNTLVGGMNIPSSADDVSTS